MKSFKIKIGRLWAGPMGAVEQQDFEVPLEFDGNEILIKSPIKGHLLLAKVKGEISAVLSNVETDVELQCQRCLTSFKHLIAISSAERSFYEKKPHDDPDFTDKFLINIRDLTIDLTEMFRQEIILHFPLISLCSKGCKGLCPHCGINRNEKKCRCREAVGEENKPFKDLKKLMK